MPLELLQVETPSFVYAALYRERVLIDLAVDRASEMPLFQSIWRAKIDRSLPEIGSFVVLGPHRTGLLRDAGSNSGDEVLVQVKSRRSGGKADIVSQDIALTGATFIYLPQATTIALSRRLDKARGQQLRDELARAGITGGIVRSAAWQSDSAEVVQEAQSLQQQWQSLLTRSGPLVAAGPDAATRLITDYSGQSIARRQGTLEDHDLGAAIAALASPEIELPRGGSIMIEPTAALVAIDINAGTRPPVEVNREAIPLIAIQLRLRNLSGLILLDFAGGVTKSQTKPVLGQLEKALGDDPAGCRILGVTSAGLVEITRPRRDLPLAEKLGWNT